MADPHVISALRAKRAELSGELIAAEKRILQLQDDISSLDRTIRLFDPEASITAKLNRGTFAATFFPATMRAIGREMITVSRYLVF